MIKALEELFGKTLKLSPDLWLYILLAVVAVAFIVTLVVGLLCGDFRAIKARMRGVVNSPEKAVAEMKMMPMSVKKQYKTARLANARPSDFLSQRDLVDTPYSASLISKIWLVTFVATVICALIAFFVSVLALESVTEGAGLEHAANIMPLVVLAVGGILTLVGAIVGKASYSGAVKLYAKFVPAVDGDVAPAQKAQPEAQNAYADRQEAQVDDRQAYTAEPQEGNVYEEHVAEPYVQQETYIEPQPVVENDEEREQAIARARAEQEAALAARAAQEEAERQAAARAEAERAEAERRAQEARAAQLEAERQAAAARAAQAQAQARAQAAQTAQSGTSSADDVIARIEKIDREGAPRETMREVATLLQKERAKPENKTPEQQKKLNEALSKLLKAMSAASRK